MVLSLAIKELNTAEQAPKTLQEAVVLPFKDFINRNGTKAALQIVLFLFLYKLGDNMATALQTPFFIDLGFTKTEIGVVAKTSSMIAMTIGLALGGLVMIKMTINRALMVIWFCSNNQYIRFRCTCRNWPQYLRFSYGNGF